VIKDPVFRDKLVELEGHLLAAEYNGHRLLTAGGRGEDSGLPGIVTKLHTTTIGYHIGKLAMDMMSDRGCLAPGEQNAPAAGMFGTGYMWYFGMALGGGAPNIQRNVISERGLGLPRDPRR
jgi:alkylation response protein AidB-like acyl-CoA dehydrogenase